MTKKEAKQQRKDELDRYLEQTGEVWHSLKNYYIELGVFSSDDKRKKVTAKYDISNAELMFIHENGTMHNGGWIPPRPVLSMTLEDTIKEILPIYMKKIEDEIFEGKCEQSTVENLLEQMCMEIQSHAQLMINDYDKRLTPNAQSTIDRKGYDHPLFKTGQLERSIQCHLIKK